MPVEGALAASASQTLEDETCSCPALGRALPFSIYLPPGYGDTEARFPVVYLLHGVGGNHKEWLHDGHVRQTLDRLIAEGKAPPMIVVMPEGLSSWYVDSAAIGGPGDFATAIGRDLPAEIDARWRTRAEPGGRAIGGLSMGGFGALRLAFAKPFRYVAAASFSGAFWGRVKAEMLMDERIQRIFDGSFGRPFDSKRFVASNPMYMLDGLKDPGAPAVFLTVGDHDRFRAWIDTFQLFRDMRERDLAVDMRMTGGDHDWDTWAEELPEVLEFFGKRFGNGS